MELARVEARDELGRSGGRPQLMSYGARKCLVFKGGDRGEKDKKGEGGAKMGNFAATH